MLRAASRPTQACMSSVTSSSRVRPKSPLRAQPPSSVAPIRVATRNILLGSFSAGIFGRTSIAAARRGKCSGARRARPAAAGLSADRLGLVGLVALDSDGGKNDDDCRFGILYNRFPAARTAPDPGKLHDRSHLVFPRPS